MFKTIIATAIIAVTSSAVMAQSPVKPTPVKAATKTATQAQRAAAAQDAIYAAIVKYEPSADKIYAASEVIKSFGGSGGTPGELVSAHHEVSEMANSLTQTCPLLREPSKSMTCRKVLATTEATKMNLEVACMLRGIKSCVR